MENTTQAMGGVPATTISMWDILLVLGRRKLLLFGMPILAAILMGVYCVTKPPIYTATARVLPPQYNQYNVKDMNQQLGGESSLGNASLTIKNPSDLYIGILRSTTILDALIKRFDLAKHYDLEIRDDVRIKLFQSTDVNVGKDGILLIVVEDESAQFAADLANAYVDELYNFSRDLAQKEATRRTGFYESVLTKAKEKLDAADAALLEVQKRTGFTNLGGQDEAIVSEASMLQENIAQRRAQLQSLLTFATERHPDVVLLRGEIASMEAQVAKLMQGRHSTLNNSQPAVVNKKVLSSVEAIAEDMKKHTVAEGAAKLGEKNQPFVQLGDAPEAMLEHTQKTREVEYWKGMVEMLGKFNEMGKIDETRDLSLIQLLDKAVASHYKSKPKTKLNVMLALVVTFMFCLIYIIFAEWIATTSQQNAQFAQKVKQVKRAWSWRGMEKSVATADKQALFSDKH